MKTPTKILFCSVVLLILIGMSGCYYQAEAEDGDGAGEEQVSYIGEELGEVSEAQDAEVTAEGESVAEAPAKEVVEEELAAKPAATTGSAINVYEGELVQLQVKGSDPDGDSVTYSFSAPLDENGKWQTKEGDSGDYLVTVTASDGKTKSSKTLKISVMQRNAAPVMEQLAAVTVKEGETVSLSPAVSDSDGDEVVISYSGWMTKSSKTTGFEDSGNYKVTITASDGKAQVSQEVGVTVLDVNRAPEFEIVVS